MWSPLLFYWMNIKADHFSLSATQSRKEERARPSRQFGWGGITQRVTGLAGCSWRLLGWPSRSWGCRAAAATAACQRCGVCCGWWEWKQEGKVFKSQNKCRPRPCLPTLIRKLKYQEQDIVDGTMKTRSPELKSFKSKLNLNRVEIETFWFPWSLHLSPLPPSPHQN